MTKLGHSVVGGKTFWLLYTIYFYAYAYVLWCLPERHVVKQKSRPSVFRRAAGVETRVRCASTGMLSRWMLRNDYCRPRVAYPPRAHYKGRRDARQCEATHDPKRAAAATTTTTKTSTLTVKTIPWYKRCNDIIYNM